MTDRLAAAREAMRTAFQVRRSLSIPREVPLNPFDTAQSLGVDVWFIDAPSLEGMFARSPDARIILPSLRHRPHGRVCFSCAHELGHEQLGHGDQIDEYTEDRSKPTSIPEMQADVFASSLLMPRPAVLGAFSARGADPVSPTGLELLSISMELSVGLQTLVKHMHWGLEIIGAGDLKRLLKYTPKVVRESTFGTGASTVVPVDAFWRASTVDIEIGHAVALQDPWQLSEVAGIVSKAKGGPRGWSIFTANRSGTIVAHCGDRQASIRIARSGYVGPFCNRYLTDPEGQ